ncbi:molybdopterin binding oxidoreductase [Byssothecium circinans]|uniref:Molybdopterin binding oxidoreductase n=1 Tax=Byssothecium circinans TaxID=147558 RepID=A0A6A5UH88_9PLEO|nr:molybdopterin binding oxidoreductase [Byssothecium circinans]
MSTTTTATVSSLPSTGSERNAAITQTHGFRIRHPPKPHLLSNPQTNEDDLFLTIHMGAVDVDTQRYLLVIDGLVERPYTLTFDQLRAFPSTDVTAFHECFGSPLAPPTKALWRVGNVTWTGVTLRTLLEYAQPLPSAKYLWSDGLDSGTFAGVTVDRYQKDLPLEKALAPETLVAWAMNGEPLGKERGGPVRLVVPGWFGTNSTKWLCKLSLQDNRAKGPYTTKFYNIEVAKDVTKPVWEVDVNSMITKPGPDALVTGSELEVEGWAWSCDGVAKVEVSWNGGESWQEARVGRRKDFSWQKLWATLELRPGEYTLMTRATSREGKTQALTGWRNHVHRVRIRVMDG